MYQAITTKYIGPSNVRGSRVKATAAAGSVTLHWDNALNAPDNHLSAALALAVKMKWHGRWHGGVMQSGEYCFVLENEGAHGKHSRFTLEDNSKIEAALA